jgi:hypothetical protein
MSRKPSRKPKPHPGPYTRKITKETAAIGQVESAIFLWFNGGDPISILVLASNAEDCFHAIGKRAGKSSFYSAWLEKMPESFRDRSKYIQDFAKHGRKDLDEEADFATRYVEAVILSAIDCCKQIHGKDTPLMRFFEMRLYLERPEMATKELAGYILERSRIHGFGEESRKEFFETCLLTIGRLNDTLHNRLFYSADNPPNMESL